ncbi:MAG: LysR family transcriptional regulator [Actinobacteria bacterium]|nr:MAG: LysR family transcriptional regulator [Actinomycetota bacterium]
MSFLKTNKCELKVKMWLEKDGQTVFGQGRKVLLQKIDQLGSLNKAAKEMGMSYRTAWGKIKDTEDRLNTKLIDSHIGGVSGGGATLTKEAKQLIKSYDIFCKKAKKKLEAEYKKIK